MPATDPPSAPEALLLPFAAPVSDTGLAALRTLALPHLERLLGRLQPEATFGSDEWSLTPPHERALAEALGWRAADGLYPFAARQAQADGLAPAPQDGGWALLTPAHWHVGAEVVSLLHPDDLQLDAGDSRALLDAVRPLLESEGWRLHWGAPTRWYAVHASLAALPSPSLDRVIGRNVDPWLPAVAGARPVRRLQAEVQMLLHTHPLNAAREARGALPVNSFWLSGCGVPAPAAWPAGLVLDDRLAGPALHEDWAAWADDWRTLDGTVLRPLLERLEAGRPVALTLCGERLARRYRPGPKPALWRRLAGRDRADPITELQTL